MTGGPRAMSVGQPGGLRALFEPRSVVLAEPPGGGEGQGGGRLEALRARLLGAGYEGAVRLLREAGRGDPPGPADLAVVLGKGDPGPVEAGARVVLPQGCWGGIMNPRLGLVCVDPGPWPLPEAPEPGPVALLGETGSLGLHAGATLASRDLGLSLWASTGTLPGLELGRLVAWAVLDPETEVVACHGPDPGDPGEAARALALAREHRKPVVVLGDALGGGHLDGPDVPLLRAKGLEQWLDVVHACSGNVFPRGPRTAIGSACAAVASMLCRRARALGLEPVGGEEGAGVARALGGSGLAPGAPLEPLLTALLRRSDCDVLVLFVGAIGRARGRFEAIAQVLERLRPEHPERLMVLVGDLDTQTRRRLEATGWLVVPEPERALGAVAALLALSGPLFRDRRRPRRSARS